MAKISKETASHLQRLSNQLTSHGLDPDDQNKLLEIVNSFEGKSLKQVVTECADYLNPDDAKVFYNFHKNIESFKRIIGEFEKDSTPSNKVVRGFFFANRQIDDSLFTALQI
jgi:hypothetical protein